VIPDRGVSGQFSRKRARRHILLQNDETCTNIVILTFSLQLESPSITIMPRSLPTHSFATSSPSEVPSTASKMPPCIMPLIHSYSSDMADVSRIIFVSGGRSFLINRGSRGVNVANCQCQSCSSLRLVHTYKLDKLDSHPVVSALN
jgi:hypothetical protein